MSWNAAKANLLEPFRAVRKCRSKAIGYFPDRMTHELVLDAIGNAKSNQAILECVTERIERMGGCRPQVCGAMLMLNSSV